MNTFAFLHLALQNEYLIGWVVWGLIFAVLEGSALYIRRGKPDPNHDGGTLSEQVWRLVRGYQWYHRAAWLALGLGLAVLTYHFLFQPLS